MELLIGFVALAAGAVLLLQAKYLPSADDFKKAQEKLQKDLLDPEANTTVGKYMAFVQGDYQNAMPFLVHSSDKVLASLATHELDDKNLDTGPKKVGMGDEWVVAAKKNAALSRIFYDRAAQWYSAAWPDLDAVWKDKARQQGRKLAISRPPGGARKGVPSGWVADPGRAGALPVLDGNVARSGSYSVKISPADPKVDISYSALKSDLIPLNNVKVVETAAYYLPDGTDNGSDRMYNMFFDAAGTQIKTDQVFIPVDTPFWGRVVLKSNVPPTAVRYQWATGMSSKKGNIWVDDVSISADGKELLKNGSFEIP